MVESHTRTRAGQYRILHRPGDLPSAILETIREHRSRDAAGETACLKWGWESSVTIEPGDSRLAKIIDLQFTPHPVEIIGFRGYPVASIAFYGPDDRAASKVAVGIIAGEHEEPLALERWFSEEIDVRSDLEIGEAILEFIGRYEVKTVVMTDGIIGCPHEEGRHRRPAADPTLVYG